MIKLKNFQSLPTMFLKRPLVNMHTLTYWTSVMRTRCTVRLLELSRVTWHWSMASGRQASLSSRASRRSFPELKTKARLRADAGGFGKGPGLRWMQRRERRTRLRFDGFSSTRLPAGENRGFLRFLFFLLQTRKHHAR